MNVDMDEVFQPDVERVGPQRVRVRFKSPNGSEMRAVLTDDQVDQLLVRLHRAADGGRHGRTR